MLKLINIKRSRIQLKINAIYNLTKKLCWGEFSNSWNLNKTATVPNTVKTSLIISYCFAEVSVSALIFDQMADKINGVISFFS